MFLLSRGLRAELGILFFLCMAPAACGQTSGEDGKAGGASPSGHPVVLSFDDASTLVLAPGATETLTVTAAPSDVYVLSFALVGGTLDGSLDEATVFTDKDGHGLDTLHAPTHATTFRVRASLLGRDGNTAASAERAVAVSDQGVGAVRVDPVYLGQRTITTWTASVTAGATCNDLVNQGQIPGEPLGAITVMAPTGSQPFVDGAPVGPNLAVALRAGHFAWGCTDTLMLTANSTLDVPVTVIDRPIDLDLANLTANFDYTPDQGPYGTLLGDAVGVLLDAFMPSGSSEGTVVLNGMAAGTAVSDATAFALARVEQGWDTVANAHFTGLEYGLRATCDDWATAGTMSQSTSFQANLAGAGGDQAVVMVTRFGDLDAASAGVTAAPSATWSGQADDSVLLSATLLWEPSRFAGAACLAPAQQEHPGVTVAAALALEAHCDDLAAKMGPFGACNVQCVEQLCDAAIQARWTAALETSQQTGTLNQLVVQASAAATVGDLAQPVILTGHWLGQVSDTSVQLALKGGALEAMQVTAP